VSKFPGRSGSGGQTLEDLQMNKHGGPGRMDQALSGKKMPLPHHPSWA
jgi:hypothetical protein